MAVPLIPLGITAARAATPFIMPAIKSGVQKYAPKLAEAASGLGLSYLADKYISPFMTPDPDAGKPQIETFPELTEAEKLPQTTGGVVDINNLIDKPLVNIPEKVDTNLIYTPVPEI